jgi:multidrug efflux pump subunit AcrB
VVWREGREWAITVQSDVVDGIQGPTVSSQIEPQARGAARATAGRLCIRVKGAAADSGSAEASIAANLPLAIFIIFTC